MPVEIRMPPLSQTSDTLLLLEWLKEPGDKVNKGEALFIVETDKASLEVEAPESGILYEILAQPQTEISVRSVIGTILKEGEESPSKAPDDPQSAIQEVSSNANETLIEKTAADQVAKPDTERIFSSPRARHLARQHGLDLSQATPSGPRGMVVERDLEPLIQSHPQVVPESDVTPINKMRQVIARRMMESHLGNAPVTYMSEADATPLVELRTRLLSQQPDQETRLTYTDLLIKIVCRALREHPEINATFENDELIIHRGINMGIAVDSDRGLMVPVLRDADQMDIWQIADWRRSVVEKIQRETLSANEMSGGTFTITNLGALSVDFFTPIINPPQVAILGVGRIREAPAVVNGGLFIRHMISLALTCDHRFIDGAPAARFMHTLHLLIEQSRKDNQILGLSSDGNA